MGARLMAEKLRRLWQFVRRLSGDDAYERYLKHCASHHGDNALPLSKKAYFKQRMESKWSGINRCC